MSQSPTYKEQQWHFLFCLIAIRGHDDAIAIVLALASPELDVKAITSSAGNQTPDKTLRNVLRMLTLLNRTDIPVAGGAVKPLMRDLIIADNVHGESGLDGPALPEPAFAPQDCTAVELMAKTLRESAEPMTIVSTGPQTNVALLLNSHPELHAKIARIVIMGVQWASETGHPPPSSTSSWIPKPRRSYSSRVFRW